MPLGDPANRRIAAHLRNQIKIQGKDRRAQTHPRRRHRRLATSVSRTHYNDVELFRKAHPSILGVPACFLHQSRLYKTRLTNNNQPMRLYHLVTTSVLLYAWLPLLAQQLPAAITTDPAPDKAYPAVMETFQIPSHGAMLNALAYVAEGAGPHPVVILLHGFPGNERNLDLAQAIRRDGWDVVYFDYRGSWGSPGDFSFTHSIEDTQSAIAYLSDATHAKKLRSNPAYIVLIGHSMGGFMARYVGALDPAIKAVGLISAADMGVDKVQSLKPGQEKEATARLAAHLAAEGMAPLAGCTPESLAKEVVANAAAWNVVALAPKLANRPMLVITSDDGLAPSNDAFVEALRKAGATELTIIHMTTDHSYSDQRIALQKAVLDALEYLQHK
jgi:pimeloyl-ACP methyl ester carboxylesterase